MNSTSFTKNHTNNILLNELNLPISVKRLTLSKKFYDRNYSIVVIMTPGCGACRLDYTEDISWHLTPGYYMLKVPIIGTGIAGASAEKP